ncbi:class E sortase [Umezawaea beigongshangensis]|uniref:class E sortase n=1 Tax=Umezawaea beigongshangensis TaxID=2780383 RepID=UPI0027DBC562|nr:class E sortase [Umezawaea beigongshangensis]
MTGAPGRRPSPSPAGGPPRRPPTPQGSPVADRLGGAPRSAADAPTERVRARAVAPPVEPTQFAKPVFTGSLPPAAATRPPQRPAPPVRPRTIDAQTVVIPRVGEDRDAQNLHGVADADDEYDVGDEDAVAAREHPEDGIGRKAVRGIGELLITAGLVVLLFVVYEVYVTDLVSAGKQDDVTAALDDQWGANTVDGAQREAKYELIEGSAFAKIYIPVFGPDYKFSIVEGTTDADLEVGPGHYVGTALPGEPGNFAVAGHRVGKGSPFNDLDLLNSCDAVVVETQTGWFVYRVLPMEGEEQGWAEGRGRSEKCANVAPMKDPAQPGGGPYAQTVGQEIVSPKQGEVINPIPHYEGEVPVTQQASLLTLTTCHPRFSDKERLIIHATLVKQWEKNPDKPTETPPELEES